MVLNHPPSTGGPGSTSECYCVLNCIHTGGCQLRNFIVRVPYNDSKGLCCSILFSQGQVSGRFTPQSFLSFFVLLHDVREWSCFSTEVKLSYLRTALLLQRALKAVTEPLLSSLKWDCCGVKCECFLCELHVGRRIRIEETGWFCWRTVVT